MTDFRIIVEIDPKGVQRGGRQVRGELTKINTAADRTRRLLLRAFAFVGLGLGLRGLIELTDQFTQLNNRIRTVIPNQDLANGALQRLGNIAKRTRTPLQNIVQLFQRGSIAAKELGISQEELFKFTERVGQAIAIQGSKSSEAAGALFQLSQALGSSIVRAEEFNSIQEGAFPIVQAVADGIDRFGGSVAQLRAEIVKGKVTSEEFFAGFIKGSEGFEEIFARTTPTITQAFQVLRDQTVLFLGELDKGPGLAEKFAKGLLFLADNLDIVTRALGALVIVLLVDYSRTAIPAAIKATSKFTKALLRNPFVAVVTALVIAIAFLISFADKLTVADKKLATLADVAVVVFDEMAEVVGDFITFFQDNFGIVAVVIEKVFSKVDLSISGILTGTAFVIDKILGLWVGVGKAIIAIFKKVGTAIKNIFIAAFNGVIIVVEKTINKLIRTANALLDFAKLDRLAEVSLGRLGTAADEGAASLGKTVKDAFLEGFDVTVAQNAVTGILDKAEQRAKDRAAAAAASAGGGPAGEGGAAARNSEALQRQKDILLSLRGPQEEYSKQVAALDVLFKQGKITTTEFNTALRETQLQLLELRVESGGGSFADGFLLEIGRMTEGLTNLKSTLGTTFGQVAVNAVDSLSSSLANVILGTEDLGTALKNVATQAVTQLLASLIKLGIQYAINAAIGTALGAAATAAAVGEAAIVASAWAPAAAFASLATLGANSVPAAAAIASTVALSSGLAAVTAALPGFATGGSFMVGGSGGTDSQLVGFRATPNERVTVETPNQQRRGKGGVNISFSIDARGADVGVEAKIQDAITTAAPLIVDAARQGAKADTAETLQRRRL